MNNSNNNNNNNSKSYKDYKYVYTGHEDYCKKHNIKTEKKLPKKEEQIIHDHRFVYDFNNPTQHTHDYSFNFNNPNEHTHDYSFDFSKNPQPKNITANSKTNYINTYQRPSKNNEAKPMATTAKSTSTPARSTTTRKTMSQCLKDLGMNEFTAAAAVNLHAPELASGATEAVGHIVYKLDNGNVYGCEVKITNNSLTAGEITKIGVDDGATDYMNFAHLDTAPATGTTSGIKTKDAAVANEA